MSTFPNSSTYGERRTSPLRPTWITAGTSSDSLSAAAISVVHGTPLYFETAVTPSDATGQFSIIATNTAKPASYSDFAPVAGTGDLTTNDLPGGTYTVSAYYAGDTSHIASQSSNSISLTVSPEASTTSLFFGDYDPNHLRYQGRAQYCALRLQLLCQRAAIW